MQLLLGLFIGTIIGILAWRLKTLSQSGAIAASISGGLIFGLGGLPWAILLMTFFISSSLLSHSFEKRKRKLSEKFSKGSQRDWKQVLANGGLGTLIVIFYAILPSHAWLWIAFAGAIAAVNADTWGTELGVLNPTSPVLITTGKRVERGTSGGISLIGTLAVLGGAALIALFSTLFPPIDLKLPVMIPFLAVTLGGFMGAFFDSLLGATIQAIYYCPVCEKETERFPVHTCGNKTYHKRGWLWLDNDYVNFSASILGASIAAVIWIVLG
jgi:uncharacterized protein (TIGR00297 family)